MTAGVCSAPRLECVLRLERPPSRTVFSGMSHDGRMARCRVVRQTRESLRFLPYLAVTADQTVRGTVMAEFGLRGVLNFRDDALCESLAKLNAPLVERVNSPDCTLREHAVLVEGNELAERFWRELIY